MKGVQGHSNVLKWPRAQTTKWKHLQFKAIVIQAGLSLIFTIDTLHILLETSEFFTVMTDRPDD